MECQKTTCLGDATLQPACTCTGKAQCTCPSAQPCPNHFACQNAACLTQCLEHGDCASGYGCADDGTCRRACQTEKDCQRDQGETCGKDGLCSVPQSACDCSIFNNCSGHGICTEACTCQCDDPWTGLTCSDLPVKECAAYDTCDVCREHQQDGCTWCASTFTGESGVCSPADACFLPEVCQA